MARALMHRPRRTRWRAPGRSTLAVALVAAALSACGPAAPPIRDVFFTLEPALTTPASPRPVDATLQVGQLAARGFLGGTRVVYRTAAQPLLAQRHDDLLWEAPPARALSGSLADGLRASGLFAYVVTIAERARADWLLQGELTRFEHRPTDRPPRVAAAFNLTLVGNSDRKTRFAKTYSGEEPITGTTPEAMALAFNRLTARLIDDVIRDLSALTPRLTVPPRPARTP